MRLTIALVAYLLVIYAPIPWRVVMWLLPYAGDWAYRKDRASSSTSRG